MSSPGVVLVLRLVHILSGVFWVGGILILARFMFPAAQALGPAAGPFMDQVVRVRKLPYALISAGSLTVLSGFALYWRDSLGFRSEWMRTPTAMVFGTGAVLAVVALAIGLIVNAPAARRLSGLAEEIQGQGGAPKPEQQAEIQRLQKRIGVVMPVVTILVVLATAAMAVARYVT